MGCIGRIGCLIVLALVAAAAWWQRDRWLPRLTDLMSGQHDSTAVAAGREGVWQPLTVQGSERARRALAELERPNGPPTVAVSASDLGAYVYQELARQLPSSADSVEVMTAGDQLHVRAVVRVGEFRDELGPLAAMLRDRERLQIGGTLRVVRPGLGELVVRETRVGQLPLPPGLVMKLLQRGSRRERPPGISEAGLPIRLPEHIGEIRVADGSVMVVRRSR